MRYPTFEAAPREFGTLRPTVAPPHFGRVHLERVKSGMLRARLEGRQIGRARLDVDREQVVLDRSSGLSLTQVAKKHNISRASVCRMMKEVAENTNRAVLTPSVGLAQQAGAGR